MSVGPAGKGVGTHGVDNHAYKIVGRSPPSGADNSWWLDIHLYFSASSLLVV